MKSYWLFTIQIGGFGKTKAEAFRDALTGINEADFNEEEYLEATLEDGPGEEDDGDES